MSDRESSSVDSPMDNGSSPTSEGSEFSDFLADRRPSIRPKHVIMVEKMLPWLVERDSAGQLQIKRRDYDDPVMAAALRLTEAGQYTFTWVGGLHNPGDISQSEWDVLTPLLKMEYNAVPVFIHEPLWVSFCKRTLWPLMNSQLNTRSFQTDEWKAYKRANKIYADVIASLMTPMSDTTDMIWVHNYHLFLIPALLRELGTTCRIGYFVHTPWPTSEIFRNLPVRDKIVKGLLGSNLVGFQTYHCCRHFLSACARILGLDVSPSHVQYGKKAVAVGVHPVGIDPDIYSQPETLERIREKAAEIRSKFPGMTLIVGRDKMDYLMGIPEKLRAFESLLEQYPEWVGKAILLQICPMPLEFLDKRKKLIRTTSFDKVSEDAAGIAGLRSEINMIVGRINGKYSSADFSPIHLLTHDLDFIELAALYAACDACLLTPLREGMNLISHAYIACQQFGQNPLILSEFTGSAMCLVGAFLVNPHDVPGVARVVHSALKLKDDEKKSRHELNWKFIQQNNVTQWSRVFLEDLGNILLTEKLPWLRTHEVISAYRNATKRILIFGYDGTLTPIQDPGDAVLSEKTLMSLKKLTNDPTNSVYVVSSRDREFMGHCMGDVPVGLGCEYSIFFKECGDNKQWEDMLGDLPTDWKDQAVEIFTEFLERTPGATMERKEVNVTFHYRHVEKETADYMLSELLPFLHAIASKCPIDIVTGDKSIEVRPQNFHKGATVRHILRLHPDADFIMCIGYDQTDEDMYGVLHNYLDAWRESNEISIHTPRKGTVSSHARKGSGRNSKKRGSAPKRAVATTTSTTTTTTTSIAEVDGEEGHQAEDEREEGQTAEDGGNTDPDESVSSPESPPKDSTILLDAASEKRSKNRSPLQAGNKVLRDLRNSNALNNRRRSRLRSHDPQRPHIFTCSAEEKDTQARFHLPSHAQVTSLIKVLGDISTDKLASDGASKSWGRVTGIHRYSSAPMTMPTDFLPKTV